MPVPLKALRSFPYAGRALKAGQDFSALTNRDANILIAVGHAQRRELYETRVMTPSIDLESMNIDDLRALASRLGVRVHHRAGVEKLRAAIRGARG